MGDDGQVPYCDNCERPFFSFSCPCIIAAVLNEKGEITLIRQKRSSSTDWVLVAGYVKAGETGEECVIREVLEETGLKPIKYEYLTSYYHQKRDQLMLAFSVRVHKGTFRPSEEISEIAWFNLDSAGQNLRKGSIAEKVYLEAKRRY